MKLTFIGAGFMAESLFSRFFEQDPSLALHTYVMNSSNDQRLQSLKEKYRVHTSRDYAKTIPEADVIFIATLPEQATSVAHNIKPFLNKDTVIVSILAGIPIETFTNVLPDQPIARLMPNTPAQIGEGASGIAWHQVNHDKKETVLSLLRTTGVVVEVKEDDLHTVTALSGSGPAYVYFFIEALEQAAIEQGLAQPIARQLAVQTIKGAASMVEQTQMDPSVLRERVTSPGGTTAAGLQQMMCGGFADIVQNVIDAASMRSRELGNE